MGYLQELPVATSPVCYLSCPECGGAARVGRYLPVGLQPVSLAGFGERVCERLPLFTCKWARKREINVEAAARFHDHTGLWKAACLEEARDRVDGVVGRVVAVVATLEIDVQVERLEREHILLIADRR